MGWDTDAPAHVQGPLAEPALCVSLVVVRVASSQGVWGRGEKTAWGRGYCPCVRPSVRTDGSSPEASRPRRKKLCFFAKLKCGAATRGSQTRSATELALD